MSIGPSLIYGSSAKNRQEKAKNIIENLDKKLLKKDHPDKLLISVKDKNSIGIEISRKIVSFLALKPFSSKYKIVVVEDAEKLTVQAQNALLKTLEEPPEFAVILLETKTEESLIPTVISRCRRFNLKAEDSSEKKKGEIPFGEIYNMSVPEKLDFAEKLSKKEKDVIVRTIEEWIREAREKMLDEAAATQAKNINQLISVKTDLETTNVNTRLAIEYLLITIIS